MDHTAPCVNLPNLLSCPPLPSQLPTSNNSALHVFPPSELEILGVLGEGSYGRVYLAEWHATPCAVKLLLSDAPAGARGSVPQPICSSLMSRLMEEADVMLALRCAAGLFTLLHVVAAVSVAAACRGHTRLSKLRVGTAANVRQPQWNAY